MCNIMYSLTVKINYINTVKTKTWTELKFLNIFDTLIWSVSLNIYIAVKTFGIYKKIGSTIDNRNSLWHILLFPLLVVSSGYQGFFILWSDSSLSKNGNIILSCLKTSWTKEVFEYLFNIEECLVLHCALIVFSLAVHIVIKHHLDLIHIWEFVDD